MKQADCWAESTFGRYCRLDGLIPDDCSVVVLCRDGGTGLIPVRLLLRHQIYEQTLLEIAKENPDTLGFVAIPVNSSHYVEIHRCP